MSDVEVVQADEQPKPDLRKPRRKKKEKPRLVQGTVSPSCVYTEKLWGTRLVGKVRHSSVYRDLQAAAGLAGYDVEAPRGVRVEVEIYPETDRSVGFRFRAMLVFDKNHVSCAEVLDFMPYPEAEAMLASEAMAAYLNRGLNAALTGLERAQGVGNAKISPA